MEHYNDLKTLIEDSLKWKGKSDLTLFDKYDKEYEIDNFQVFKFAEKNHGNDYDNEYYIERIFRNCPHTTFFVDVDNDGKSCVIFVTTGNLGEIYASWYNQAFAKTRQPIKIELAADGYTKFLFTTLYSYDGIDKKFLATRLIKFCEFANEVHKNFRDIGAKWGINF